MIFSQNLFRRPTNYVFVEFLFEILLLGPHRILLE